MFFNHFNPLQYYRSSLIIIKGFDRLILINHIGFVRVRKVRILLIDQNHANLR